MRTVTMKIYYGGFVGAEKKLQFDVEDDATDAEIDERAQDEFENFINGDCYWDIEDIEEAEVDTW